LFVKSFLLPKTFLDVMVWVRLATRISQNYVVTRKFCVRQQALSDETGAEEPDLSPRLWDCCAAAGASARVASMWVPTGAGLFRRHGQQRRSKQGPS